MSLEESWPSVIEAAEQRFGHLDVMVANAGIGIMCKAEELSLADWRRQTAVNLDRLRVSEDRRAWPATAPPREGCGSSPRRSRSSAAGGDNIRVNTVHPLPRGTPAFATSCGSIGMLRPAEIGSFVQIGVSMAGQAQDIANGVLFLASDASSYMTGAELVIDGGMRAAHDPAGTDRDAAVDG